MADDTGGGVAATRSATSAIQAAAHAGGNPGILVMTDQEGGQVKRLPGPPWFAAADMSEPTLAYAQGRATGEMLKRAGVNVDLAPVADVVRTDGFINEERRSFGSAPASVSSAACNFAFGLAAVGVAYTLKHFPGLGDATLSTDNGPVRISEPASKIYSDDAAYRNCGRNPLALIMVSSASYTDLTGSTPAVLAPRIYSQVIPRDGITGVLISDDFESRAIAAVASSGPARTAINAGLDMLMYAVRESAALRTYSILVADARNGLLSRRRLLAASDRVLQLKAHLGLIGERAG
jgi:beta-N-acetylhexosaminidase